MSTSGDVDRVIEARGLRKAYGSTVAVDDISFEVRRGEIFTMVGPNGAGKTTTIECIEGQRRPDAGAIRVLGLDPHADGRRLRHRVGIQLQESNLPSRLKVWEAVRLFASFYASPVDGTRLLASLGLEEHRKKAFKKLSGGQKQRLFIALALVNEPELLFLDELTTGLDPHARRSIWGLIREIRDQGRTVFLTTHLMEEAERLSDRVAIIDAGRIVVLDTPEGLIRSSGLDSRVVFSVEGNHLNVAQLDAIPGVSGTARQGDEVVVTCSGDATAAIVRQLEAQRVGFAHFRSERPSLDDVFLALTGGSSDP